MADIKDRLAEALTARNMTQAELARSADLDKGSITHYIKGDSKPGSDAVVRMAKALHVRPGWLIGGEGDIDDLLFIEVYESMDSEQKERLRKYANAIKEGIL